MRVVAVPRLPKFGPGNGTVLGPVESVPILMGPKNESEIRTRFWPRFSHKLALSSELFNLEFRDKTAENKSLGKVMTSYAELQQAAVADEQVGNNDRQQKLCSCVFTSPTSEEGTPALWRPLVHGNVFEQFSTPQNRPLIWLVVAKADPHLRIAATGKPLLNFNPLLRLPKMHAKNTNCFLAMNAISCRKT